MSFRNWGRRPRRTQQQSRERRNELAQFNCANPECGGKVWSKGHLCADCVSNGVTIVKTQQVAPPPPPNIIQTGPPRVQPKKQAPRRRYEDKF